MSTMDPPGTLDEYFKIVDDFFRKTFRDDSQLFIAIRTRQSFGDSGAAVTSSTSLPPLSSATAEASAAATGAGVAEFSPSDIEHVALALPPPPTTPKAWQDDVGNFVAFSPRMVFGCDGGMLGKVKVALNMRVPYVCTFQQALLLNTQGVITLVTRVRELLEGLVLKLRMSVNLIAPASQDVITGKLHYRYRDFYSGFGYQRNSLGSSNLLVDFGSAYWNCLIGAGFERQQLSYLEQKEGPAQIDVLYGGVGFSDTNWSIGAKIGRTIDAWSTLRIAALQRLSPTTAFAWSYTFDVPEAKADVAVGFTQGFQLRLPTLLQYGKPVRPPVRMTATAPTPHAGATAHAGPTRVLAEEDRPAWTTPVPLVLACKAESGGQCSCTLRGLFNDTIRWGLVMHKNLYAKSSSLRFGLTLSTEALA